MIDTDTILKVDSKNISDGELLRILWEGRKGIKRSVEHHRATISDFEKLGLEVPKKFIDYLQRESSLVKELERANTIWRGVPIFDSNYQSCCYREIYVYGICGNLRHAELWGEGGDHILKFWRNGFPNWTYYPVKRLEGEIESKVYGISVYNFGKIKTILKDFVAHGTIGEYTYDINDNKSRRPSLATVVS